MSQKRKDKKDTTQQQPDGQTPPEETKPNPEIAKKGKKLKEDLDKLIDEIDEVLEENAEEFVKSYVQRGGE